jgi:hypothetical protein
MFAGEPPSSSNPDETLALEQLDLNAFSSASPADRRREHRGHGSRRKAAAFLARSPTKSVSARSLVQNSGARSDV